MKKKVILAAVMAALVAASLAGCSSTGSKDTTAADSTGTQTAESTGKDTAAAESTDPQSAAGESKEAAGGTLVMGTNAQFPPYEFYQDNKIVGIDAEIAQAIADKLGMKLEIEDMAFDAIVPSVVSGKIDFGAAGMTVTDERKQAVDFTDTYATSTQVIIVADGSSIKGKDDLDGKLVGVQLGTTGDMLAGDIKGAEVERYKKGVEAVESLKLGKIDAVIIDQATAKAFVKNNEGIQILAEALSDEQYALALKKGNTELLDKINGALKELKADGTLDQITAKYIKAE